MHTLDQFLRRAMSNPARAECAMDLEQPFRVWMVSIHCLKVLSSVASVSERPWALDGAHRMDEKDSGHSEMKGQ
jgi:hypothetical protein